MFLLLCYDDCGDNSLVNNGSIYAACDADTSSTRKVINNNNGNKQTNKEASN